MLALSHRVKVFVYSQCAGELQYLILKHLPRHETVWGPIEGPIHPSENLELAACRRVRDEIGLERPVALVDLRKPERWSLPEESIVEWVLGYRTEPGVELRRIASAVSEFRWNEFEPAFHAMELPGDRDAILRLHLLLTTKTLE